LMTAHDFDDRLLPTGRLREPLSSLARADAITLPDDFVGQSFSVHELTIEGLRRQGKLIWRMQRKLTVPPDLGSPVAFCGIARPQQFFAQVHDAGITPAAEVVFRDHHFYQTKDVDRLLAMRRKTGAVGFLTTEKDAVNLGPLRAHLDPFAVATLRLTLDTPNEIVDAILAKTIFLKK
jgi:tetraacyldisaccharide 4'-kinase